MVSVLPLIPSFYILNSRSLGTVLRIPITIGIAVTFIFYSFFLLSGKIRVFVNLFAAAIIIIIIIIIIKSSFSFFFIIFKA